METSLGVKGLATKKHTRRGVRLPFWAPNLGRVCDALLLNQQISQIMPAARDPGLRQRGDLRGHIASTVLSREMQQKGTR